MYNFFLKVVKESLMNIYEENKNYVVYSMCLYFLNFFYWKKGFIFKEKRIECGNLIIKI